MSTVVWFRSDLRADDNSALAEAARDGARITGLFLLTPAQWGAHDWGARKQLFVWRHVLALRERLAALGIPLWVRLVPDFAGAPAAVADLARAQAATPVYANPGSAL